MARAVVADQETANMSMFETGNNTDVLGAIRKSVDRFKELVGTATDATKEIVASVDRTFQDLNFGETYRKVMGLRNLLFENNNAVGVRHLNSETALNNACEEMQRWIMCHPELRKRYVEGTIDGYSQTYTACQDDVLSFDFYDYRRATDGMVMEEISKDKDGKEVRSLASTSFLEELHEYDNPLTTDEQYRIMATHDSIDRILSGDSGFDFTEVNSLLGEDVNEDLNADGEIEYNFG